MSKRDMIINPITGEIDLDLHRIVKGFSEGGQSLKDSLKIDTPRRTPSHPSSSHVVKTKVDGKDKMIRFGEQGAKTAGAPKAGESDQMRAKRKSFKARHASNIDKGKSSAAYWSDREKWGEGGSVYMAPGGEVGSSEADDGWLNQQFNKLQDWRQGKAEEKAITDVAFLNSLYRVGDAIEPRNQEELDAILSRRGLFAPLRSAGAQINWRQKTESGNPTVVDGRGNPLYFNIDPKFNPNPVVPTPTEVVDAGVTAASDIYDLGRTYLDEKVDEVGAAGAPLAILGDAAIAGVNSVNNLADDFLSGDANYLELLELGTGVGATGLAVSKAFPKLSKIPKGSIGMGVTPGLDNLLKVESGNNLNATLIGKTGDKFTIPGDKAVSEMTMKELAELQDARGDGSYHAWSKDNMPEGTMAFEAGLGSTPVGKYQFVGNTLKDLKNRGVLAELNITDDTVFDEKTQDRLFVALAEERLSRADTPKGKRDAMRGTWEGLKGSSDEQVDIVIAEIEGGNLSGSADTAQAVDSVEPSVVLTDTPHRLTPAAREVADKRIALEREMALLEAEIPGEKKKIVRNKVKIDDLAKTFDADHIEVHGRKLDPTVPADQLIAAKIIASDIDAQMTQANSGAGWYDADVQKTFEMLGEIPGLEDLQNNETKRIIWSALAAPTSIGQKVIGNTKAATAAMLTYARTGEIPIDPPLKDTTTQGIKNAGWGQKQKSVAAGMKVISKLIEKYGEEGFADWWLSPHTLKELTDIRKEAGLSGGPSGLSGGKDSIHLGAMVLGDKTGRFSLNINGYEGTTKDVWYSRSYNRAFGQMFGATDPKTGLPEVQGGPRNQTERRQMEAFNQLVLDNTALEGLSEADAQAVLWFFEQGLYSRLGVESRPGSFSEGVGEVYGSLGLRQPVRGSDGIEIEIEPPAALDNFRDTSGRQRAVRANRRVGVDASADSSSGNLPQSGPYGRGSTGGDGSDGLLVFEADQATLAKFQAAGLSVPTISQVDSPSNAVTYNADMVAAMAGNRFGPQVEIKSAEDLSQANLFRTPDGSGFAIKPDGDIVAVFASPGEPKGGSYAMLQAAVQAGGTKLDAFDTYLPDIYESVGFRPVARLAWNDDYAPEGWDKDVFKKYNNGEPDVVFFVHDPSYFGGAKDVPVVADYDQAVSLQDQALEKLTSASGSKPKGSGGSGSNDSGLSIAQEIATMLASGRTDGVTDELLDSLDYNDTMELFELYKSGATGVAMPMDTASRDARAEAMFPRDDYYHGTNADIKGFQGNVFSSENPTLASTYARGSADAQIYPLRLGSKLGDTMVEGGGVNWNQLNPDEIYKTDPAVAEWLGYDELSDSSGRVSTRGVERAAMREGRSGVQFKDINDIGPGFNSNQFKNLGYTKEQERDLQRQYMEDLSKPSNVDVRLSPNLVRSKFARFDPRLKDLKNLSAVVPAGVVVQQGLQNSTNEEPYDPDNIRRKAAELSLDFAIGGRVEYNPDNIRRNAAELLMEADNG